MNFEKAIAYVEEAGLLAEVVGIDFRDGTYILEDDNEAEHKFTFDKVEVLEKLFTLNGLTVFNKDVLGHVNGSLYLVTSTEKGYIVIHELDKNLEIVKSGSKLKISENLEKQLEAVFDLQGNYYELLKELPKNPEFDVEVVKNFDGEAYNYFYACNDKNEGHIDLISVVFVGAKVLKGNEYSRETLTYEEYSKLLADGTLKSVSLQELSNYALGVMYGVNEEEEDDDYDFDVNSVEDEDYDDIDDLWN